MTDPYARLALFARRLRSEGISVGTGDIASFCAASSLLEPPDLYWAGRATLISRRDEIAIYDRVFRAFFGGGEDAPPRRRPARLPRVGAQDPRKPPGANRDASDVAHSISLASSVELLRRKSFARCTPDELEQLAALMRRIALTAPSRRSRRREPARRGSPDFRRTLRRSFRTGGEPLARAWQERRTRRRRLVLLLDVSGSMSAYSRALLVFAHAALRADARWEAFCFSTRLTRLTRALATLDPDEALRRAGSAVADWDGGTRIGESLKRFLDEFGHGGIARGSLVVICSDGLDVGEPELLGEQMARLSRLAHRVIWLNPLKEDPAYEPLARGMRAALPYVDVFSSGHNLESLELLGAKLSGV